VEWENRFGVGRIKKKRECRKLMEGEKKDILKCDGETEEWV